MTSSSAAETVGGKPMSARSLPRWPLYLIALPAAVAIWGGWVSLGQLCGFGLIQPLPGIVSFHLNTAITLPVGVESYGAYAMGAWLTPGTNQAARRFAKWSAIGALTLGLLGQVAFHLLAAAHATRAPWLVVVLVSSLPVITLGFGAALSHLLRADAETPETQAKAPVTAPMGAPVPASEDATITAPEGAPAAATGDAPEPAPESVTTAAPEITPVSTRSAPEGALLMSPRAPRKPVTGAPRQHKPTAPEDTYAALLAVGELPSIRAIRRDMHVGDVNLRYSALMGI